MKFSAQHMLTGALGMLIAVATGAFGAHALKNTGCRHVGDLATAVHYQMVHALGLLGIGILHSETALASFSTGLADACRHPVVQWQLYLLALSGIRWLGAVTPFGGVAFLLAWGWLAQLAWRQRNVV
jgi:uncharacterized membrane protein YgdD (TMEM256/DUF423 family)